MARMAWSLNGTYRRSRRVWWRARRSRPIDELWWDRTYGVDGVEGHQEEEEERGGI